MDGYTVKKRNKYRERNEDKYANYVQVDTKKDGREEGGDS